MSLTIGSMPSNWSGSWELPRCDVINTKGSYAQCFLESQMLGCVQRFRLLQKVDNHNYVARFWGQIMSVDDPVSVEVTQTKDELDMTGIAFRVNMGGETQGFFLQDYNGIIDDHQNILTQVGNVFIGDADLDGDEDVIIQTGDLQNDQVYNDLIGGKAAIGIFILYNDEVNVAGVSGTYVDNSRYEGSVGEQCQHTSILMSDLNAGIPDAGWSYGNHGSGCSASPAAYHSPGVVDKALDVGAHILSKSYEGWGMIVDEIF